jgi:hypothetical protein
MKRLLFITTFIAGPALAGPFGLPDHEPNGFRDTGCQLVPVYVEGQTWHSDPTCPMPNGPSADEGEEEPETPVDPEDPTDPVDPPGEPETPSEPETPDETSSETKPGWGHGDDRPHSGPPGLSKRKT